MTNADEIKYLVHYGNAKGIADRINHIEEENARLKAEVERLTGIVNSPHPAVAGWVSASNERDALKAEVERLKNNCDYLDKMLDDELDKSAMLCGQVMRLLNTGDAMQKRLVFLHDRWDTSEICEESEAWDAAKESKPNE